MECIDTVHVSISHYFVTARYMCMHMIVMHV